MVEGMKFFREKGMHVYTKFLRQEKISPVQLKKLSEKLAITLFSLHKYFILLLKISRLVFFKLFKLFFRSSFKKVFILIFTFRETENIF